MRFRTLVALAMASCLAASLVVAVSLVVAPPLARADHPPRHRGHAPSAARVTGIAATGTGDGYWVVDVDGGIFAFGDADFHGSVPDLRRQGHRIGRSTLVGIAPTPSGDGYWLLDRAGGMFSFGDARFHGSVPDLRRQGHRIGPARIVGIASTRGGRGYWLLDHNGGIFTFGDADFHGSLPSRHVPARAVDIEAAPDGRGYWILSADGSVHAFGSASAHGSGAGRIGGGRAVDLAASPHGSGYWLVNEDGRVVSYPGGAGEGPFARGLFTRLNDERRARGLEPLSWNPDLADRALGWARVMANRGQLLHSPNAGTIGLIENIGYTSPGSPGQAHLQWMRSALHRDLRLAPSGRSVGVAAVCDASNRLWVIEILAVTESGRPAPTPPEPLVHDRATGGDCESDSRWRG